MRIWLDQGGAYGNLGDEAMLSCAVARLRRLIPDCRIVISAQRGQPLPEVGAYEQVESPAKLLHDLAAAVRRRGGSWLGRRLEHSHGDLTAAGWLIHQSSLLPPEERQRARRMLEAIDSCDAYYAVGAANLHDWSLRHHVLPRAWTVEQFAAKGKPVFIVGQTVGPLRHRATAQAVRAMAMASDAFTLRDPELSDQWMRWAGAPASRLLVTGDEAFDLPEAEAAQVDQYLYEAGLGKDEPYTLAHIRGKNYVGSISGNHRGLQAILAALGRRESVLLCPMSYGSHSGDDAAFAREVTSALGSQARCVAGSSIRDAKLARALVARSRRVVALSYHLQVFALACARPLACLISGDYYRHKAHALLAWLPVSMRFAADIDAVAAGEQDATIWVQRFHDASDSLMSCEAEAAKWIAQRQDAFHHQMAQAMRTVRRDGVAGRVWEGSRRRTAA
ncbi:MAG: polysaccharide pyruvyl transferase family protein [Phycisphaeraceae bacterium]|nr:polysaccharide pyruvyl transferase family protein [Phycisphaeraceae bacterium]